MVYFLYGQDTYRLAQKAKEIENQFCEKNRGAFNLEKIDAITADFYKFWDSFSQRSMFIQNKLFFLDNVFDNENFSKDFSKKIKDICQSSDIVVVLQKGEISKTNALFKALVKAGPTQEFKKLDNVGLKNWAKKEINKLGAEIDPLALNLLISFVGDDLWRLNQEIRKLAANNRQIREEHIKALVKPKIDTEIFQTVDALGERNKRLALYFLQKHLDNGDSPFYIFSMFVGQFRNLLMVKSCSGEPALLSRLKLHPFVLKKTTRQASFFSLLELKKIYQNIFSLDLAMKTGKLLPELALKNLLLLV